MLIGAIADSHVLEALPAMPSEVFDLVADCELILHAGDITDPSVLTDLRRIAPVLAVQGDHDRAAGLALPHALVTEVEGHRIGLVHGRRHRALEVAAAGLSAATGRLTTLGLHRHLRRAVGPVDAVVYGHLHVAEVRRVDGVTFVNPGGIYTLGGDFSYLPARLSDRAFARATSALDPRALQPSLALLRADRGAPLEVSIRPLTEPIRPTAPGAGGR